MDDMSSNYTSSGYNAVYTHISSWEKAKKIIEFSTGDSHMVTTHCSTDQGTRFFFTAERTGCETFIILRLNKVIFPCSEYTRSSSNAVPSPSIAAANTATHPAPSKYYLNESCICQEWKVPRKHTICHKGGNYGGGDGFGDCGVGGVGSGDKVAEGHIECMTASRPLHVIVFD